MTYYREVFRDQVYKWLYDKIKPDTLLLDIGAAIGDTATYFAMHPNIKEIWSYEPNKKVYKQMQENLKRANFKKPIQTYNYGLERLDANLLLAKGPVAIKCDAEGAECSLFNAEVDLSKVYAIIMEYHYGLGSIVQVLKAKGFKVIYTKPKHVPTYISRTKPFEMGYIYAWK